MRNKTLAILIPFLALALPAQSLLAEESAGAKPGLLDLDPAAIIWVLVIFILLVAILYKAAWKNVLAGLKAREERIRADIADAETNRKKSEATLNEYRAQLKGAEDTIRDMLAKAAADAERLGTSLKMQAQQDVEAIRARATREIEASKTQAIGEIYAQAADLATSVAGKILRRNLNVDDQRALVNDSLEQLQTVKG